VKTLLRSAKNLETPSIAENMNVVTTIRPIPKEYYFA
jgi:hypothetical protein